MPIPRRLPQLWGIPASKYVRLGLFTSKLLNHVIVHLWRHAIFHEMTCAVPNELGTHGLDHPPDSILLR